MSQCALQIYDIKVLTLHKLSEKNKENILKEKEHNSIQLGNKHYVIFIESS